MADDILRMRASVVTDEALINLRALGRELGLVGRRVDTGPARRQLSGLRSDLAGIGTTIRGITLPALSAAGFAGGGLGAALTALAIRTKGYNEEVADLARSSKSLGMSAKDVRAFVLMGERLGITADQTGSALKTLSSNFYDFKRSIGNDGGVAEQLRQMGQGDLLNALRAAKDMGEATSLINQRFEFLNRVDPQRAKRLAEALTGIGEAARWTSGKLAEAGSEVDDLTEKQKQSAEEYNKALSSMGQAWKRFTATALDNATENLTSVMNFATRTMDALRSVGKALPDTPSGGEVTPLPRGDAAPQAEFGRRTFPRLRDGYRPMSFGGGDGSTEDVLAEGVFQGLLRFSQYQGAGGGGGMMNAAFRTGSDAFPGNSQFPRMGGDSGAARALNGGGAGLKMMPGGGSGIGAEIGAASSNLSGSEFLKQQRARFADELEQNPALRKRFAALIDLENPGAGTAVAESALNRGAMTGRSLESILSGGPRSFYGPARRGMVGPRMRELERNPRRMAERMAQIDAALAGSNLIRGHTDQGSAGDPNYHRGGVGVNINRERFNDWGGFRGVEYSRRWRMEQQRQVAEGARRREQEAADIDFEQGGFSRQQRGGFSRKPAEPIMTPVPPEYRSQSQSWFQPQQQAVNAQGKVEIVVNNGSKVEAKTSGELFQETKITNYKQWTPTSTGGGGHPDAGF